MTRGRAAEAANRAKSQLLGRGRATTCGSHCSALGLYIAALRRARPPAAEWRPLVGQSCSGPGRSAQGQFEQLLDLSAPRGRRA
jgi:hypothetical protein